MSDQRKMQKFTEDGWVPCIQSTVLPGQVFRYTDKPDLVFFVFKPGSMRAYLAVEPQDPHLPTVGDYVDLEASQRQDNASPERHRTPDDLLAE